MISTRATFTGILWNSVGKSLEYVLVYATSVIVARGLGVYQNGVFAVAVSVAQMIFVLCSLGLETSLNTHLPAMVGPSPEPRIRYLLGRVVGFRIGIYSAIIVLLFGILWLVAPGALGRAREFALFFVAYAGVRAVIPLFTVTFTARMRTDVVAAISVGARTAELIAIVVMLQFGLSIPRLLGLLSVTGGIQIVAFYLASRSVLGNQSEPTSVKPILTFGLVFWLNVVVDYFLGRHGDIFLLSAVAGDANQASFYDVAYSLVQVATLALTIGFSGVTLATFARLFANSRNDAERFYGFLVRISSLLTVPLFGFLLFNGGGPVRILYSDTFSPAVALVRGMVVFRIASRLFGGGENTDYLLAQGSPGVVVAFGVGAALVNIGLDVLLIPSIGAWGAVIGSGVANLAANVWGFWMVNRRGGGRLQFGYWGKLTLCTLVVSWLAAQLALEPPVLEFAVRCAGFIGALGISLYVVKPLKAEDLAWISGASPFLAAPLRVISKRQLP